MTFEAKAKATDADAAEADELDLRHRLADAVARRAALLRKADRYVAKSRFTDADPAVADAADAARERAAAFEDEVTALRAQLRAAEGRVAGLDPDLR